MLPEHHFVDDRRWIQQQLMRLPLVHRKRAIEGYSKVYRAHFDGEPEELFKVERARFAANSRLRRYVQKALETML
jgi:hypothetical protein